METHYRHRLLSANEDRAELEVTIEAIDLFYEGRHLGSVDWVPEELGKIYATVYQNGAIEFDREVFLMGDPYEGFELIATRYYNGYVMDEYRSGDGYVAGRVDLGNGDVRLINRSRLFDPFASNGFIPISLLPENEGWLWDYGSEAISATIDDYDYYYGTGSSNGYSLNPLALDPLRSSDEYQFRTNSGVDVLLRKDTEIQRVE